MNLRLAVHPLPLSPPAMKKHYQEGKDEGEQDEGTTKDQQLQRRRVVKSTISSTDSSTNTATATPSSLSSSFLLSSTWNCLPADIHFSIARFLNARSLARYTSLDRNTSASLTTRRKELLYQALLTTQQQQQSTQFPSTARWLNREVLQSRVIASLQLHNAIGDAEQYFKRQHSIACELRHTSLLLQEDRIQRYIQRQRIYNCSIYEEIVLPILLGLLFCWFVYSIVRAVDTNAAITWHTTWPLAVMSLLTALSTCHFMYGRWMMPKPTTAQLDASAATVASGGQPRSPSFLPHSYYIRSECFLNVIFTRFDKNFAHTTEPGIRPDTWTAQKQVFAAIMLMSLSGLLLAAKLAQTAEVTWFFVILPVFISLLFVCLIIPIQYRSVTTIHWPSQFTVRQYCTMILFSLPLMISFFLVCFNILAIGQISYLISLSPLFLYDILILLAFVRDFTIVSLFGYLLCGGGFLMWHTLWQMKLDEVEWWMAQWSYGRIFLFILPTAGFFLIILIGQRVMRWWKIFKTTVPYHPNRFQLPDDI